MITREEATGNNSKCTQQCSCVLYFGTRIFDPARNLLENIHVKRRIEDWPLAWGALPRGFLWDVIVKLMQTKPRLEDYERLQKELASCKESISIEKSKAGTKEKDTASSSKTD